MNRHLEVSKHEKPIFAPAGKLIYCRCLVLGKPIAKEECQDGNDELRNGGTSCESRAPLAAVATASFRAQIIKIPA